MADQYSLQAQAQKNFLFQKPKHNKTIAGLDEPMDFSSDSI